MARILAIDFGQRRTGIAVTDELQIIASGLTTVNTKDIFKFLGDYLESEDVELFVVGEPKQMDSTASESELLITPFITKLKNQFPKVPIMLPCYRNTITLTRVTSAGERRGRFVGFTPWLYPINGGWAFMFIRLIMPSHPQ